ncbi:MAG TPA: DUF1684 domain-containing protein [Pyrinomonadaceae bacterium]|jgi:uncharacterized protein (DUF1684 family)|nr:DUF1684 domain-containing protein [Pyrinomonadaceae bacterium]
MKRLLLIALAGLLLGASLYAQTSYNTEIAKWRSEHEKDLRTDNGWLTVAGLMWLKQGVNTVGSGGRYDVELTSNFPKGKFGEITLNGTDAVLIVAPGIAAMSTKPPVSVMTGEAIIAPLALTPDDPGPANQIKVGSQTFYLIKRENKLGIRLKDSKSPGLVNFKGEKWYPVDSRYKINADFEPYPEPKEVMIPNVLGGNYKEKAPGLIRFKINGKEYTLMPVIEDDHLFIIFRDLTSRTTTYGAGRFLYAPMPKDGKVELDFNKAENPPCAFTSFATCPLPPIENRLTVAIPAGEKRNH